MIGIPVERLPGVLGHELRNPLASAMTGVMLARELVDTGDPRAAVLDGVLADLDRITALIDGWLATARGGAPTRSDFGVAEMLLRIAARHGAQLVCVPDGASLHGNAPLLERALDNLVENARQAGARTVRLAAQVLGTELTVHVEDDGCGIAAPDLPQIFRAGFSGRGGNGLGLYSVATTVAAHGGSISCQPLQRGTRFSLKLPLQAADALCP